MSLSKDYFLFECRRFEIYCRLSLDSVMQTSIVSVDLRNNNKKNLITRHRPMWQTIRGLLNLI